jgi:hypothetical protein
MLAAVTESKSPTRVETTAEVVSTNCKFGRTVLVEGPLTNETETDIESAAEFVRKERVTVAAVAVSEPPIVAVPVVAEAVKVSELIAAFEGTFESALKLKAKITASAMRLKFALLDICFLSIVAKETFSFTAGENEFAS